MHYTTTGDMTFWQLNVPAGGRSCKRTGEMTGLLARSAGQAVDMIVGMGRSGGRAVDMTVRKDQVNRAGGWGNRAERAGERAGGWGNWAALLVVQGGGEMLVSRTVA